MKRGTYSNKSRQRQLPDSWPPGQNVIERTRSGVSPRESVASDAKRIMNAGQAARRDVLKLGRKLASNEVGASTGRKGCALSGAARRDTYSRRPIKLALKRGH